MAQTIKLKKSSVSGLKPSSLEYGELALNFADGNLYYKNSNNLIKLLAGINVVSAGATSGTLTIDSDITDLYSAVGLTGAVTFAAPTATSPGPRNGQKLVIRIEDDGLGARTISSWATGTSGSFRAVGVTLPTTTVLGKVLYVGCIYNSTDLRWDVVAVAQE